MQAISQLNLKKGQSAVINTILNNPQFGPLDHSVTRRLRDLGFCEKTPITVIAHGFLGSPLAVRLGNGAQFSLRAQEAAKIQCYLPEAALPEVANEFSLGTSLHQPGA